MQANNSGKTCLLKCVHKLCVSVYCILLIYLHSHNCGIFRNRANRNYKACVNASCVTIHKLKSNAHFRGNVTIVRLNNEMIMSSDWWRSFNNKTQFHEKQMRYDEKYVRLQIGWRAHQFAAHQLAHFIFIFTIYWRLITFRQMVFHFYTRLAVWLFTIQLWLGSRREKKPVTAKYCSRLNIHTKNHANPWTWIGQKYWPSWSFDSFIVHVKIGWIRSWFMNAFDIYFEPIGQFHDKYHSSKLCKLN